MKRQSTLIDGLQVLYPLNEASGNAIDVIGSLNMTAVNAPGAVAGPANLIGARSFVAASTQYFRKSAINTGNAMQIRTSDAAYSFWFQTAGSANDAEIIFNNGGDIYSPTPGLNIIKNGSNGIRAILCDGSANGKYGFCNAAIALNVWHHFVLNVDRDGYMKFWLDSLPQETYKVDISSQQGDINISAAYDVSSVVNSLTGYVAQFGKWNRLLTQAEISELYNNGSGVAYPF